MSVAELNFGVLVGAVILLVAIAAVRITTTTGTPSLLLYLGIGVAIGESGLGLDFDDYQLTTVLGYAALALILADGGLSSRWTHIRSSVPQIVSLATIGTATSVAVTGSVLHLILGLDLALALLIAAVPSSTDSAAVFSVLRRVPLPRRLTSLVEAESGANDAPVVIAVSALTLVVNGHDPGPWWLIVLMAFGQLLAGALIGLAVGGLGASSLRAIALPASGLYPIAVVSLCAIAYGAAAVLGMSGFIAVYLCAVVLGNARLPHGQAVRGFAEGLGWLGQIGLFVLLGILVAPSRLLDQVGPAIVVGLVLLLVGRPLSVALALLPFRMPWREQVFLSWAGLRGAVPIMLATIPAAAGAPGTERLFELVFVMVVIFTMIQAPTLPALARWLKLGGEDTRDLDVESSPLGALGAEVLQVTIGRGSRLAGIEVFELRLPVGANVTLVVRDGEAVVPDARTPLRAGDQLLLVVPASVREETELRLEEASRHGRLARWRDGAHRRPAAPAPVVRPSRWAHATGAVQAVRSRGRGAVRRRQARE